MSPPRQRSPYRQPREPPPPATCGVARQPPTSATHDAEPSYPRVQSGIHPKSYPDPVRELIAVALPGGPAFLETLLRTWDRGDAILPIAPGLPVPAMNRLLEAMRPSRLVEPDGIEHKLPDGVPVEEGDAIVIATSGSSGEPKGAVHTHKSISASAKMTNSALEVEPATDRWLCCLPLSHIGGLSVVLRALDSNTPLEIHPSFEAAAVEDAARLRDTTLVSLVPTALARIDPLLFRRVLVGGSAAFIELPPNAVATYGMTETGSAVAYNGRILPGAEVRIVNGEIHVRGEMLMRCYRDNSGRDDPLQNDSSGNDAGREGSEDGKSNPFDAHGWFATGDSGSWDSEGQLVVHGRRGDMITTGGEKVWPVVVEQVLESHPDISDVAVIGENDPEWGQVVVALVVPSDPASPPTLASVREHVKADLPDYMAPRHIRVIKAIPRTALGKLRRAALGQIEPTQD